MRRTILLILTSAALLSGAEQTFTGVITDTMCGKSHTMMGIQPDDQCVAACTKGSSRYALFDGQTLFRLSDQKTPARFAARRVKVTGTLNEKTKTIQVTAMEAGN
jgi:hypothetical protein